MIHLLWIYLTSRFLLLVNGVTHWEHFPMRLIGPSHYSYRTLKWQDLRGKACIVGRGWLRETLPTLSKAEQWIKHKVDVHSCYGFVCDLVDMVFWPNHEVQPAAKAVGPNSSRQGWLDLTRRAGQEKYHQTILLMFDLSSNILTILDALMRESRACTHSCCYCSVIKSINKRPSGRTTVP